MGALVAAGCGSDSDESSGGSDSGSTEPLKFGGTLVLSGTFSASCLAFQDGVQAWLDKVNEDGGVNGRQIEWEALDDANDPARAVNNVRQLDTKDNVLGMFANCGSAGSAAIVPYVDGKKMPLLFPDALSAALLRPPHATIFTAVPLFSQQLAAAMQWALEDQGPGKVAVVYIDGLDDQLVPAVEDVTEAAGGTIVADIPIAATETNWGPTVIKLKQAQPDYIAFGTSTPQAGQLVAAMAKQGYKPGKALIGMMSLADPNYVKGAGVAAAEGSFASSPTIAPTDPRAEECNATLPSGTEPSMYTVLGCASAKSLVETIERAGDDVTREALVEAVEGFDGVETGVSPPLTNRPTHLLVDQVNMVTVEPDGSFKSVADVPIPERWAK